MARRINSGRPGREREEALIRIELLFGQAEKCFGTDPCLANRYVALARRIAMKLKARIRPELRRRFCRHCYAYLKPGVNLRVRTTGGHVTYYCLDCKKFMRFPYVKERRAKRRSSSTK